jgi:hypothetical protein
MTPKEILAQDYCGKKIRLIHSCRQISRLRFLSLKILIFIGIIGAASLYPMPSSTMAHANEETNVIHVLVALCDNDHQGIVKVSKHLGNGDDTKLNLYWGNGGGVKSVFSKSPEWKLIKTVPNPKPEILERAVFQHKSGKVFLVADGYRGREIKKALEDFFTLLAGKQIEKEREPVSQLNREIHAGSGASLVVYLGHNGLMDIEFESLPSGQSAKDAIVLCCKSKQYFSSILDKYGANPVLLTTQLMYPGAMVLEAAFDGWLLGETREQIRVRAGKAMAENQKISEKSAIGIFSK